MGIYSIDSNEIDEAILNAKDKSKIKTCVICGKQFLAVGRNASRMKVCSREHHKSCECCGKDFIFKVSGNDYIPKCCSKDCSNKLKMKNLHSAVKAKYGVDNVSQHKDIRKKIQKSLDATRDETKQKRDKTMPERYGVLYPMQNAKLKAKIQATNEERYGHKNPAYNEEIRMKLSERMKSPEVLQKYYETSMKNWGVPRPSMMQEVQDKMKATCLERYGVEYATQDLEILSKMQESMKQALLDKYDVDHFSKIPESREKAKETMIERYGVSCGLQLESYLRGNEHNRISRVNIAVAEKLKKSGIEVEFEFYLSGKLYDLHVIGTNILIEINPTYTHNSVGNHWNVIRNKDYHLSKTTLASENGYRCIHIFEWDDINKIINMLRPKETIYARNCVVKEISQKQANEFLRIYHLQGSVNNQKTCLGLYHKDDLIQVMTFGSPRYNKNYEYELLRLCTKSRYAVTGGANKLFSYFCKHYNPSSIISYCDISKFNGDVYEKLGMTLDHTTSPVKIWSKDKEKVTNNLLLSRGYDQLFRTNYGKGTNNEELMLEHGWLPVYDCGQKVYVWNMK